MKLLPATLDHDQDQLRRRYQAIQACFDAFQDQATTIFSDEKVMVKLGITVSDQLKGEFIDFRFAGETIRLRRQFALNDKGAAVGIVKVTHRQVDEGTPLALGAFTFAANGKTAFGIGEEGDARTALLSSDCPEIIAYYFRQALAGAFKDDAQQGPLPLA